MVWNPFRGKEEPPTADPKSTRHLIVNRNDLPIYVSVEPWPECFELEKGESLALVIAASDAAIQIEVIDERELVVYPASTDIDFLIDDKPAADRSWQFKHERPGHSGTG